MRVLIYAEIDTPSTLDDLLGQGVDDGRVEKYALLTIDGAPVIYECMQDSAPDYLNGLALRCGGITEE